MLFPVDKTSTFFPIWTHKFTICWTTNPHSDYLCCCSQSDSWGRSWHQEHWKCGRSCFPFSQTHWNTALRTLLSHHWQRPWHPLRPWRQCQPGSDANSRAPNTLLPSAPSAPDPAAAPPLSGKQHKNRQISTSEKTAKLCKWLETCCVILVQYDAGWWSQCESGFTPVLLFWCSMM